VVRGRLCHILSFVVGKCFWHFARPAIFDSQLLDQNRDFCLYHTCIRRPRYGGSRGNIATPFCTEKLEWCGYPMVKKVWTYVYSFWHDPRTWQTDGHRMTAITALMHSIARQKPTCNRVIKYSTYNDYGGSNCLNNAHCLVLPVRDLFSAMLSLYPSC